MSTSTHKVQVLHLLAIARSADVELTIDDFQMIADRTPYLANLRPSGKYFFEDVHRIGGLPALMKYLLNHSNLLDGSQMTVTGKTLAQNLEGVEEMDFANQDVIFPLDRPLKRTGHIAILKGNLAPTSAVAKITGKEGLRFEVGGPNLCENCNSLMDVFFRALRSAMTNRTSSMLISRMEISNR
jgi:dihydroxy-acid dehydratase